MYKIFLIYNKCFMEYFSLVHLLSTQNLIMFRESLHDISCDCEKIYSNEIMKTLLRITSML